MLSQFTREGDKQSLADLEFSFPKDVYPIGRLDADSEGLLLLSNDPSVNKAILDPLQMHWRTYLVQVEGEINQVACELIAKGVSVNIKGKNHKTLPCNARLIPPPQNIHERVPPVRFRKSIPTSFVLLELREGKYRQVRKMTAAVGFPTLRLIRLGIEDIHLGDLRPGAVQEFEKATFFSKLKI